jgi:hypothetical protein
MAHTPCCRLGAWSSFILPLQWFLLILFRWFIVVSQSSNVSSIMVLYFFSLLSEMTECAPGCVSLCEVQVLELFPSRSRMSIRNLIWSNYYSPAGWIEVCALPTTVGYLQLRVLGGLVKAAGTRLTSPTSCASSTNLDCV